MTLRELLSGDPVDVAPRLLGARLVSDVGTRTVIRICEVEAYREDDEASHSFRGRSTRNLTMFGPPGLLYVYRSYGLHWCANVVAGPDGFGAAILLRGGIAEQGRATMEQRRGRSTNLADGPGKLCQALAIEGSHDGLDLLAGEEIRLEEGEPFLRFEATPRVGISKARERHWRFVAVDGHR